MIRAAVLALALLAPVAASAEDLREFCANRPGKGSPACILDKGRWQLEGDLFDQTSGHGDLATQIADLQLRYGLTRRSELEIGWSPFLTDKSGGATREGSGDLILGVRWALTDPDGPGVAVALQPFASAPVGSHAFSKNGWAFGLTVPVAAPLNDTLSLAFSPTIALVPDLDGHGDHGAWSAALGIGESIGPVSLGQELWGGVDDDPSGQSRQASFDLTAAWVPGKLPNTQFDAGYNFGLTHDTPKSEVYVGLAHRF